MEKDRALLTADENKVLDGHLEEILKMLSPYFLAKPAHKVIEWLVRRFRVHQLNIKAVVACVLPYHDSMLFVKMCQILEFQKDPVWSFLGAVKKSGQPLPRATLVTRCAKDLAVVQAIAQLAQNAAAASAGSATTPITFFGVVCVEMLHGMDTAPEQLVTILMPVLSQGLHKHARIEFQTAAYMVLAELGAKANFTPEALEVILVELVKAPQNPEDALSIFVHLILAQRVTEIPAAAAKFLIKLPGLTEALQELCEHHDLGRFVILYLEALGAGEGSHHSRLLREAIEELPVQPHLERFLSQRLLAAKTEEDGNLAGEALGEILSLVEAR